MMNIEIDYKSKESPFRQIAAQLREDIIKGIYPPGTLLPSVRQIMHATGISITTVQKAFTQLQQEKLIFSTPGKGNYVAKSIHRFNNRIYVFLPSSSLSFFMKILSGLTEQANNFGYEIIMNALNTDKLNWNDNTIDNLYKARDEGAAVIFIEEAFGEVKKVCMDVAHIIPFVTVEWSMPGASAVINNYAHSIEVAFEKLLKSVSFNKLLILKGRDYQYNVIERMKGYSKIIDSMNWLVEKDIYFRSSDFDAISGYSAVKEFLKTNIPDCIFCANDYEAIGAIGALTEIGLLAGKDVRVIGYGDMVDKVTSYFPITTISQNLEKIGKEAVLSIYKMMEGNNPEMHIINTHFVPGRT